MPRTRTLNRQPDPAQIRSAALLDPNSAPQLNTETAQKPVQRSDATDPARSQASGSVVVVLVVRVVGVRSGTVTAVGVRSGGARHREDPTRAHIEVSVFDVHAEIGHADSNVGNRPKYGSSFITSRNHACCSSSDGSVESSARPKSFHASDGSAVVGLGVPAAAA